MRWMTSSSCVSLQSVTSREPQCRSLLQVSCNVLQGNSRPSVANFFAVTGWPTASSASKFWLRRHPQAQPGGKIAVLGCMNWWPWMRCFAPSTAPLHEVFEDLADASIKKSRQQGPCLAVAS